MLLHPTFVNYSKFMNIYEGSKGIYFTVEWKKSIVSFLKSPLSCHVEEYGFKQCFVNFAIQTTCKYSGDRVKKMWNMRCVYILYLFIFVYILPNK